MANVNGDGAGRQREPRHHALKVRVLAALTGGFLTASTGIAASAAWFSPGSNRFLLALVPLGLASVTTLALVFDFLRK